MSFSYDNSTDAILVNDAELKFTTAGKGITFADDTEMISAAGLVPISGLDDVVNQEAGSNTTANTLQFFQGFVVGNTVQHNVVVNCFSANVIDVPTGNIYSNLHTSFISFDGSNPIGGTGGDLALQSVTERGATTDQILTLTATPVSVLASGNLTSSGNLCAYSNLDVYQTAKVAGNMGLGQDPGINDRLGVTGDARVTDGVIRITKSTNPTLTLEDKDATAHSWNLMTDTTPIESPLVFYSNNTSASRFTLFPSGRLDLNPASSSQISFRDTGAVSVGTTDNFANIYVRGDVMAFNTTNDTRATFDPDSETTGVKIQVSNAAESTKKHIHLNSDGGLVSVGSTTTSDTNLHVTGNFHSTGDITSLGNLDVNNLRLYNEIKFDRDGGCYIVNTTDDEVLQVGSSSLPWYEHRNYFTNFARFYHVSGGVATEKFRISSSGGANTFTGSHRNHESDGTPDLKDLIGYIVVSNGVIDDITIDDSLPRVELSTSSNAKNVYGVVSSKDDLGNTFSQTQGNGQNFFDKDYNSRKLVINSVGEGGIWVSNENGNIENGDYITTSNIAGIGMRQDDDILHNYTCAKAVMSCNFAPATVPKKTVTGYDTVGRPIFEDTDEMVPEYETMEMENGVVAAFIGCTYHCG